MITSHLLSITLALIIDRLIGDPQNWPHPVRVMGKSITIFERWLNRGENRKGKGLLLVISLLLLFTSVAIGLSWAAHQIHIVVGIVVEALIIATTIAQKDLSDAALRVYQPLAKGDLEKAKMEVSMIVGRDTEKLDETGVTRATVETVAESIGDGITSPLFWAAIGGAPLAILYRFVNTCDSMVGYTSERYKEFGFYSAKLDDVLNWIPSRITGFFIIYLNRISYLNKREKMQRWRTDAKKHASPNSGYLEAAVAYILGVQLGGTNYYQGVKSERALLGMPYRQLKTDDVLKSVRLMKRAVLAFFIFLWIGGGVVAITSTWF